jgi:Na+(H+)/acetate symporter ActP
MLVIAGAGLGLAYLVEFIPGFGLKYLWWCINSLGACCVIPTVLSLFWERLSAKGIIAGVCVTMCAGLLVIVYGSVTGRDAVVALGYSGIIAVSLAFAWFFRTRNVAA